MARKLVVVNQSTGYLTIDIINSFVNHFDSVELIYGEIREQDVPLDSKIRKTRVIKKSRVSHMRRFFAWLFSSIQIFLLLLFRYRRFEILYFSLPPFSYLGSFFLPNKFSLVMFDVYPDVLKALGIKESHFVYRAWAYLNRRLFARAHRVYTIGEAMAGLMSQYVDRCRIHVIPLWSGLADVQPVNKAENPFIVEHGLKGKFVVQYSGNIGGTHNIESLLEVATKMKAYKDVMFLIIGRGLKVPVVEAAIQEHGLTNCKLLPFQPDNVIRYSIASADISVILMEDNVADASIPSKVYNILAVGSCIMSISSPDSAVSKFVRKYDVGANFAKTQVNEMIAFICSAKDNPEQLGHFREKALMASREFTFKNADKYLEVYLNP